MASYVKKNLLIKMFSVITKNFEITSSLSTTYVRKGSVVAHTHSLHMHSAPESI